jgi:hypothetical protein
LQNSSPVSGRARLAFVGLKPDTTKTLQRYVAPGFIPANPATAGFLQANFASTSSARQSRLESRLHYTISMQSP